MRFRTLRIVWSVTWGILCVLVVVIWIRSYWRADFGGSVFTLFRSENGVVLVTELYDSGNGKWTLGSGPPVNAPELRPQLTVQWWDELPSDISATAPHWLIALLLGCTATLPWFQGRFSVKALLVLTTCIATLLGVLVYFSK
jgi:hypothetical protein